MAAAGIVHRMVDGTLVLVRQFSDDTALVNSASASGKATSVKPLQDQLMNVWVMQAHAANRYLQNGIL